MFSNSQCIKYVYISLDTSVKFNQSAYSVNEGNEVLQIVLVLSNPSSTDITVEVLSTDGSATGKQRSIDSETGYIKIISTLQLVLSN